MSTGGWAWMAEAAGEELAKLEAAHPGRFGPLKAELRRLVAEPGLDAAAVFPPLDHCCFDPAAMSPAPRDDATPSSSQAATPLLHLSSTQESSTSVRKRKPGGGDACERKDGKRRRRRSATAAPPGVAKDRADMAIERAQRCLERIRAVKQSLLAAWTH
ncbi:hypothetical protein QOZ80_2AG0129060 [Eleusine coracana subsp. coracana]|nr:hypothetical protein QOZ80_2AG0129060 [Eleusine coracana subsp. coracana]